MKLGPSGWVGNQGGGLRGARTADVVDADDYRRDRDRSPAWWQRRPPGHDADPPDGSHRRLARHRVALRRGRQGLATAFEGVSLEVGLTVRSFVRPASLQRIPFGPSTKKSPPPSATNSPAASRSRPDRSRGDALKLVSRLLALQLTHSRTLLGALKEPMRLNRKISVENEAAPRRQHTASQTNRRTACRAWLVATPLAPVR